MTPTAAQGAPVSSSQASRHSSESYEHHTPVHVLEAARAALGGTIDLDPASSPEANARVQAVRYIIREQNGYSNEWEARSLFLNPPGGLSDKDGREVIQGRYSTLADGTRVSTRLPCTESGACGLPKGHKHEDVTSSQKRWWQKLALSYAVGHVRRAFFQCFSVELLQSTQVDQAGALPLDFPIVYYRTRVPYLRPDGTPRTSPPHSSCGVYLPESWGDALTFEKILSPLGKVVLPRDIHPLADRTRREQLR